MKRHSVAVALLALVGAVLVWLAFRTCFSQSAPASAPQSLASDAAMLASPPGIWQSDAVKVTLRDGKAHEEILGLQFGPSTRAGPSNAPEAQVKLFTSSPTKGIPHIAEANTSFGDGTFRDVRLRETNGARTICITRVVDEKDPYPAKTQRIYDRYYSVSFRYELKNNVLTLKGFPTTNKVTWGVSEFIVPREEIQFRVAR